ncbi:NAD(P)-dependent oxidoreductase [Streptomyces sp. DSM 44915]|uniref:NAD(P)-dependent oxidoreductase n=1 Tax=Streptomyces chisholmiae TaxID=3075540 RepID=A0ABU2JUD9_9ACTN|nr:NAD(P)-dependent oxidoreductase [Streptomyces sp. DSM 44915]MDT0268602.1 NAD(P)-dependent oxidoreductase [Streptomyces sp. DSM 44915]
MSDVASEPTRSKPPRTVAVTGAAGMLGRHLVERLLRDGDTVVALDVAAEVHDLAPAGAPGPRTVRADVRDTAAVLAAVRGADVVVHAAAALPSYPADEIADVDIRGTESVLSAARTAGVPRVVHVSSTAVYGLPEHVPTPETAEFGPVDPYSRAKIRAELACRAARDAGLTVPVLRPKTFLGPQRLGLFAMLFQWADEGRHFPLLDGGRVRTQMLDVEDLVAATRAAIHGPADRVNTDFNIAATEFGTLAEDFQAVLDEAGYGRRIRTVPAAPALPLLRLLDSTGLSPVYGRLLAKLRRDSYVTTDRAATVLGCRPRWSNRASILRTYRWWREHQAELTGAPTGRTHRSPWREGALRVAKLAF